VGRGGCGLGRGREWLGGEARGGRGSLGGGRGFSELVRKEGESLLLIAVVLGGRAKERSLMPFSVFYASGMG
jgi:hypothetical protein